MKKPKKKTVFLAVFVVLVVISVVAYFLVNRSNGIRINSNNFPDQEFREIVKEYDKDDDGKLSKKEIEAVTLIEVSNANIKTLEGIEYFVDLELLSCENNRLKTLDLSENEEISFVNCSDNQIRELVLPDTQSLETLYCRNNYIASLKVDMYPKLKSLDCSENKLKTLDLSKNKQVETLYCSYNRLLSLNISKNPYLEKLGCSNNKLQQLDLTQNPKLIFVSCTDNRLSSLNVSQNKELRTLGCNGNSIVELNIENCEYLKMLYLVGEKTVLQDLTTISSGMNIFSYDNKTKLVGVE